MEERLSSNPQTRKHCFQRFLVCGRPLEVTDNGGKTVVLTDVTNGNRKTHFSNSKALLLTFVALQAVLRNKEMGKQLISSSPS